MATMPQLRRRMIEDMTLPDANDLDGRNYEPISTEQHRPVIGERFPLGA